MKNKYTKEFESEMIKLAKTHTLNQLLNIASKDYKITKHQLRLYLSKRKIRYKDYNENKKQQVGLKIPIGTERIKADGMVQVKVSTDKWEYKQRLIYSKYYNIELTSDDYIIFLDQDRTNFNIDNLMRISRHESSILSNQLMFSNNKDITKLGVLTAKLIIKVKEKK